MVFDLDDLGSREGIYTLELNHGNIIKKRRFSGQYPYAYDRKTIVFAETCGETQVFRLKTITAEGLASQYYMTPCSSIVREGSVVEQTAFSQFGMNKLSPDKAKVAVQVQWGLTSNSTYAVLIFDVNTQKLIKRIDRYANPEWHPDGRLLMSPAGANTNEVGVYMLDKNFTQLSRIDQGQVNQGIGTPDISPSGKQVIFTLGAQIWMMDINGDNLHEIIAGSHALYYATWSPDGRYIAYIGYNPYAERISFFDTASKESYHIDTDTILPKQSHLSHYKPAGPLSWVR